MTRKDSRFAIGNLFHFRPQLCGTREMESLSPPRLKRYERAVKYKAISNLNASLLGLPLRQPDVAEPQLLYTHFCDISSPSSCGRSSTGTIRRSQDGVYEASRVFLSSLIAFQN